ncbi:MAG TPA: hypothetical protein VNK23_07965 [Candidatus Dormibacteraeota bacterium]|nr:hypothetical protein [Candidatus Dormibacteraeota bacterium]
MYSESTFLRTQAYPVLHVEIGGREECWKTLAALIQKRASAIFQRRAESAEEGTELWKLAESQIERPLCCGMLKLTGGWLVSFNSAELGTTDVQVCAEPLRLVFFGRNASIGGTGITDPVVRVLRLPEAIDPSSLKVRQEGPILDIELRSAAASTLAKAAVATGRAA